MMADGDTASRHATAPAAPSPTRVEGGIASAKLRAASRYCLEADKKDNRPTSGAARPGGATMRPWLGRPTSRRGRNCAPGLDASLPRRGSRPRWDRDQDRSVSFGPDLHIVPTRGHLSWGKGGRVFGMVHRRGTPQTLLARSRKGSIRKPRSQEWTINVFNGNRLRRKVRSWIPGFLIVFFLEWRARTVTQRGCR